MRLVQIVVPRDKRDEVLAILEDEEIDFIRHEIWYDGDERWLLEFPVPSDAIGHVLDRFDEAALDPGTYTVVTSAEIAETPRVESLRERFASDFDPLTEIELRSKALDLSEDMRSFLAMIFLSTVIATAGLLIESPAVVVGSMVIAPIVGPVVTAAVGATTGDLEMLLKSTWLQGGGIAVAFASAWIFSVLLRLTGFAPPGADIASIELIALRISPGFLTVVIGLASGGAAAYGLATKGPTALIGVMIAAALIPSAATVGIAAAWNEPRIAVGAFLLVILTLLMINLGAFLVLYAFGYRPERTGWLRGLPSRQQVAAVATAIALVLVILTTGMASYDQIGYERTVTEEVEQVLEAHEDDSLRLVSINIEYAGPGPFGSPERITVSISRTATDETPQLAGPIEERLARETGHEVKVQVRFMEYQRT